MRCPSCGAADLIADVRDMPHTYKGESTVIEAVSADYCPACGEALLHKHDAERVSEVMRSFRQQVNSGKGDPQFIADVRRKLELDQKEAAEIFGGGINAFSRYETGHTRPPLALVKLLKVLDRHPELLLEVRAF